MHTNTGLLKKSRSINRIKKTFYALTVLSILIAGISLYFYKHYFVLAMDRRCYVGARTISMELGILSSNSLIKKTPWDSKGFISAIKFKNTLVQQCKCPLKGKYYIDLKKGFSKDSEVEVYCTIHGPLYTPERRELSFQHEIDDYHIYTKKTFIAMLLLLAMCLMGSVSCFLFSREKRRIPILILVVVIQICTILASFKINEILVCHECWDNTLAIKTKIFNTKEVVIDQDEGGIVFCSEIMDVPQKCPEGGEFMFDLDNLQPYCTIHGNWDLRDWRSKLRPKQLRMLKKLFLGLIVILTLVILRSCASIFKDRKREKLTH